LFSDVIVSINETIVEGGDQLYYMKSFIGTVFAYTDSSMERQLFASGFVKDEAGKQDNVTNMVILLEKHGRLQEQAKEFYGKLFVDLFQQSRYLIGNVNMRIQLIKNALI